MHITEFLRMFKDTPDLSGVFAVTFESESYPGYFFSQLLVLIKSHTTCVTLDSEQYKLGDIKAQLETSFLGSRMLYWVKNTHELDAVTKKAWASYMKNYQGPHCVMYWNAGSPDRVKTESKEPGFLEPSLHVELPTLIDPTVYKALYEFFYPTASLDEAFVSRLFCQNQKITLDEACLLMGYQTVVGRKSETFFAQWLTKLITPEKSLFTLSQYLFARQPTLFLQQWKSIKNDFPDEFWVSYWSEQLWQAALFVMRAREQGYDVAKKAAYRLPFSFINKDWQKYSQQSLIHAHQFLYKLDYNLKNSAGTHGIELWYQKFLSSF